MCDEGSWMEIEACGSGKKCNAQTGNCDVVQHAYDHTETMDLWFNSNQENYSTTNQAPYGYNYIGGVKLAVKGAFYVSGNHTVSNVTNIQRGSAGTSIVLSGWSAGIGTFSFDYKSWAGTTEEDVLLTITDGKTTKTQAVTKADTSVKTFSFDFNNPSATTVTVTPSDSKGRVLIDNIHWTSAD
jgi:hypothetical protein